MRNSVLDLHDLHCRMGGTLGDQRRFLRIADDFNSNAKGLKMYWVIVITTVMTAPGHPTLKPGDVLQTNVFGATETEAQCHKSGEKLTTALDTAGGGSVRSVFACTEVDQETLDNMIKAQKWKVET